MKKQLSITEKALSINLNRPLYGTLAEIGAGQEVARWFFKVGGAAGTIAKAMSAYDMVFSDSIYGPTESGRYVVENRVRTMLDHEFSLLQNRLGAERNAESYFFAFADTVAAASYKYKGDCHGWLGVQFQLSPEQKPSQVILHVRMRDKGNLKQQGALGILGVNLIYAAFYYHDQIDTLLASLLEGDIEERVEINLCKLEGPAFTKQDSIKTNLRLLKNNLTQATLFLPNGEIDQMGDAFYNKQVVIHRSYFEDVSGTESDLLISARNYYCGSKTDGECDPILVNEIYVDKFDDKSLEKVYNKINLLNLAGQTALVTSFKEDYLLADYIETHTTQHINFVYKANMLTNIFSSNRKDSIETIARLFKDRTKMYIYPSMAQDLSAAEQKYFKLNNPLLANMTDFQPPENFKHLFAHLTENKHIEAIEPANKELLIAST